MLGRHLTRKVSYCQCSKSPTKFGAGTRRRTSFPFSSEIFASPYNCPVYVPAYFARGSDGFVFFARSSSSFFSSSLSSFAAAFVLARTSPLQSRGGTPKKRSKTLFIIMDGREVSLLERITTPRFSSGISPT